AIARVERQRELGPAGKRRAGDTRPRPQIRDFAAELAGCMAAREQIVDGTVDPGTARCDGELREAQAVGCRPAQPRFEAAFHLRRFEVRFESARGLSHIVDTQVRAEGAEDRLSAAEVAALEVRRYGRTLECARDV